MKQYKEQEAAEFIQNALLEQGKDVGIETILLMLDLELEYMLSIGLAEHMG